MRTKTVQTSFLSGVLDPRAAGRVDSETYFHGLLTGENIVIHHLGGLYRRPGFKFLLQLPGLLTYLTPDSATAPNGGTAANGYDDDPDTKVTTTTNVSTVDPYVVVRYDMGSAVSVTHADVIELVATGSTSDEFYIQYSSNDSDWTNFGDVLPKVDTTSRTYRRTQLSSGAFSTVSARYWRVAKVGGTDMGANTVSLQGFDLWVDSGTVGNVRLFSFELTTDTRYLVAVTDRSATLFLDGAIADNGTIPLPYESADIQDLDAAVGAEAMFIVHEDYPVRYIFDEFDGEDFQTTEFPFTTLPQYDYADGDSPTPTSEIQVITFDGNWIEGDTFQIELDGARTGLISFADDGSTTLNQTTTANNIAREIQKLYTVPGFTGVSCAHTGSLAYTVTFANASAKAYDGLLSVTVGTTSSTTTPAATVVRSQAGVARAEDVWSATRGYPRSVTFFGGRLYFGGTKSKLQSLFGSTVNDIGSFEILEGLDGDPIFTTLNSQQLNAINSIFSSRSLEIFTSGGEFRYVKRQGDPIVPADAPQPQTQYGSKRIRPVAADGTTIFAQRLGRSIRDFKYDFNEDAYNSLGLSSLAAHLITGAVDLAAWQGSSTDEINLIFVVNSDGTIAVLNLRKEAEVKAWTRWFTGSGASRASDGTITGNDSIKAVATTVEEIYFAVQRDVNGTTKLFLEQTDDDMYVDCGVNVTGGDSGNVAHLTGETCRVRLQSAHLVLADQTGGTVTPSESEFASSDIQVGLDFNPEVTPMALVSNTGLGYNAMSKRRIVKPRVKVRNTLGLLVNDRELPDRYFDIDDWDDNDPTPYTGNHTIEDTTNWDEKEDKTITFTQVDPLPMEILMVAVDMESS